MPTSFSEMSIERDMMLMAYPSFGDVKFVYDYSDSKKLPTISPTIKMFKPSISADIKFTCPLSGANVTVATSPTKIHPWFEFVKGNKTFGAGLTDDAIAFEANVKTSTFNTTVRVVPDGSLPFTVTTTVAATEKADAGLNFKFDPLRSGLIDYTLAWRQACPFTGFMVTGFYNAKERFSLTFFGTPLKNKPYTAALELGNNFRNVNVLASMVSPCGRKVFTRVDILPEVSWKLGFSAPVFNSTWKLNVALAPLAFLKKDYKIGATLTSTA